MSKLGPLFTALATMLALAVVGAPTAAHASASDTYERAITSQTNKHRVAHQLVKVKRQSCVDSFAESHARTMAKEKRMYHQDLGPILKKCKLTRVGENVATGYTSGKTVVNAWMDSPGHRANILNSRFRLLGGGAVKGTDGRWYVVQVFGTT